MTGDYIDSLRNVKEFLSDAAFAIVNDNFLLCNRKDQRNVPTLTELDYDDDDIKKELLSLTEADYVYSTPDKKKPHEADYFVFGKIINKKGVYIKVKLKENKKKSTFVFCMSFHFADKSFPGFPYI